jgi:hypothetical protein
MLRLDVNTAGAWKAVVPEFDEGHLPAVRAAALALARAANRPVSFRLIDASDTRQHFQGRLLAITAGHGDQVEWRAKP